MAKRSCQECLLLRAVARPDAEICSNIPATTQVDKEVVIDVVRVVRQGMVAERPNCEGFDAVSLHRGGAVHTTIRDIEDSVVGFGGRKIAERVNPYIRRLALRFSGVALSDPFGPVTEDTRPNVVEPLCGNPYIQTVEYAELISLVPAEVTDPFPESYS